MQHPGAMGERVPVPPSPRATQGIAGSFSKNGGNSGSNLSYLVPNYGPGKDNFTIYTQKVELLCAAWPEHKMTEFVARLILGCSGSAFQKLQFHQAELMGAAKDGIKKLIELLGGSWGRIPLERSGRTSSVPAQPTSRRVKLISLEPMWRGAS